MHGQMHFLDVENAISNCCYKSSPGNQLFPINCKLFPGGLKPMNDCSLVESFEVESNATVAIFMHCMDNFWTAIDC